MTGKYTDELVEDILNWINADPEKSVSCCSWAFEWNSVSDTTHFHSHFDGTCDSRYIHFNRFGSRLMTIEIEEYNLKAVHFRNSFNSSQNVCVMPDKINKNIRLCNNNLELNEIIQIYDIENLYNYLDLLAKIKNKGDVDWLIDNYFLNIPRLLSLQKILDDMNPNMKNVLTGDIIIEI